MQGPFYFLLFYLWYAYFRPDAWIYWMSWVQSLNLSLFLGAGLLLSTIASVPRLRLNAAVGIMMLFLLHSLLTVIFSAHPDVSWASWWIFLRIWLVSYTIILLVTDLERYRLTLLVIAVSLAFEGAKQGWAGFILNPGGINTNTLPFLGDNNGVAVGMMMLVPLFNALAQTTTRRWERIAYWILGTGVFLRGLSTYSRGGFLTAIVLAIFYWVQSRHKIRALVSLALVGTLALSVMPQEFWDRMHSINAPAETRDESARGRLYFWQVGMDMAAANPILGVGFDGYEASFNSYDTSKGEFGADRAVHSTWFGVHGGHRIRGLRAVRRFVSVDSLDPVPNSTWAATGPNAYVRGHIREGTGHKPCRVWDWRHIRQPAVQRDVLAFCLAWNRSPIHCRGRCRRPRRPQRNHRSARRRIRSARASSTQVSSAITDLSSIIGSRLDGTSAVTPCATRSYSACANGYPNCCAGILKNSNRGRIAAFGPTALSSWSDMKNRRFRLDRRGFMTTLAAAAGVAPALTASRLFGDAGEGQLVPPSNVRLVTKRVLTLADLTWLGTFKSPDRGRG